MSRFKAMLRRQAGDEVQTVRELNTDVARIIREQKSVRRKERRAEETQDGRIHGQEINATQKKISKKAACTAICGYRD